MSNRETDIAIALALGWSDIVVADETGRNRIPLADWRAQHPGETPIWLTGRSPEMPDWPSSTVPDYAIDVDLEDEVDRRGLWNPYVRALCHEVEIDILIVGDSVLACVELSDIEFLFRATTDQRALAFLKAITR